MTVGLKDNAIKRQKKFWFPNGTYTTFQIARIHARMIKFHRQYFIESILYDIVNPKKIRRNNNYYNNINGLENSTL